MPAAVGATLAILNMFTHPVARVSLCLGPCSSPGGGERAQLSGTCRDLGIGRC